MSSPVITAPPETDTTSALRTMYAHRVRRLAVVDASGALAGIVTRRDLFERAKAGAPIADVMASPPYTTGPDVPIVHAAALMRTLGIGALPVLDHGRLVGMITESDIFDAFLDLLGARGACTRLIVPVPDLGGGAAGVLAAAASADAAPVTLAAYVTRYGPTVIITIAGHDPQRLVQALKEAGLEPSHVQSTAAV